MKQFYFTCNHVITDCAAVCPVNCVKCSCHCENVVDIVAVTVTLTSVISSSAHVSSCGFSVQRSCLQVCLASHRHCLSSGSRAILHSLPRLFRDLPISPGTIRCVTVPLPGCQLLVGLLCIGFIALLTFIYSKPAE